MNGLEVLQVEMQRLEDWVQDAAEGPAEWWPWYRRQLAFRLVRMIEALAEVEPHDSVEAEDA